ncbi:MAG: glycosyltransferase family 4 protein [Candidatus Omnitrophica bacterium]|nr:glycosyltransferase family 4 protein [Candidatus Omnitrophota bacterium]
MKILLINKFLYPKGGDAVCALATGDLLRSKGHEVTFWGMRNVNDPPYPYYDIFVDEVDFNSANGKKQQFKISMNMLYSLEAKSKVEELIQRIGKPDIVHLHNFAHQISPSILHVFKKYKIPCVMTSHDYKLVCASYIFLSHGKICEKCTGGAYFNCFLEGCVKDSKAKSLLNTFEMYLHHKILHIYGLVDIVIATSCFLRNKLQTMGFKGQQEVLSNFVKINEFHPQYEAMEQSICYFGRLSKEKGLATLIDAVKLLMGIQLKVIGDGPLRAELEYKCQNNGISNVTFLGYMSGNDLKREVSNSLFVVVPSEWYENNPRSVIEAFALGKPVIGARIGGIPELVKDGETGLTFEPGNADDLYAKINQLAHNLTEIKRMGRNARRFIEQDFNSEKHYEKLIEIYKMAGAKG